jgi:myo-inositol-1(or 4)-monophosphatase
MLTINKDTMDKLLFAKNTALKAGEIMKHNFTLNMKKKWKEDGSPLTVTDIAINKLVIDSVRAQFPDHNVKGEEESSLENKSPYLWVCDPLDGTIAFSHGLPISIFSLALVKDGEVQLGVAYDPFMDRMFCAQKGKGSFLNDQPNQVSELGADALNQSAIAYENFSRAKYDLIDTIKALTEKGVKLMQLCSIIYPTVLIASGDFVGSIFPHDTAHDAASIKIIVEEAGGRVTDLFGYEQQYNQPINGFIASNGKVHDELVKIVSATAKERR